jgi:integrase
MVKLAIKTLEALTPADAGRTLHDEGGLRGKVRASAKAERGVSVTFQYRYRWEGRWRDEPCGTWPRDKITEIRDRRDQVRRLLDDHIDPAEHRKAKNLKIQADAAVNMRRIAEEQAIEAARRAEIERLNSRTTVRALFERWAALELAQRKDGGAETRRGLEKDVLSAIGERYAEDVKRADLMAILDAVKARAANRLANRLLAEMRQMFGFAVVREIIPTDPTYGIKKRDVGGKDTERDRFLSDDEARALSGQLAEANLISATRHAVWVMLATGCRIGELTGARRAEVRLAAGVWQMPDSKNGKPHTVYLSDFAKHHLSELFALSGSSEWLMPGTQSDRSLCPKSISKQIYDRQRGKAKTNGTKHTDALCMPGGPWVPHDLRRTAATLMKKLGVSGEVVERCLNHTDQNKMARIYQRDVPEGEMREAWRRLGERLELLTSPDASSVAILNAA